MSAVPKKAAELADLAMTHGWQITVDEDQVPITLNYDDGSSREVETDSYVLTMGMGDAAIALAWYVNPFTDRWKVGRKRVMLFTANALERRLAASINELPRYVYFEDSRYDYIEDVLTREDPEGYLRKVFGEEE